MADVVKVAMWWAFLCALAAGLMVLNLDRAIETTGLTELEAFKIIWWALLTFQYDLWALFADMLWSRSTFYGYPHYGYQ